MDSTDDFIDNSNRVSGSELDSWKIIQRRLIKSFPGALVEWYQINKRDLPWRETRDPYKIWLSEVILQQTRVNQGMAYYHRFCDLFPTIHHLAEASEDEVLRAWQGLGYYSRARNIHHTARFIAQELKGSFPTTYQGLIGLKGIGSYTAAAIASFAYGLPFAVVDGNVIRVLARLFGITEIAHSNAGRKKIDLLAQELISETDPGSYNQAIMEFGALQCVPRNPDCHSCPFQKSCFANITSTVEQFPLRKKKKPVTSLWFYYLVLNGSDMIWLKKRSGKGIWKNLYDFPGIESDSEVVEEKVIESFLAFFPSQTPPVVEHISGEFIHLLTHRKIHAKFIHFKTEHALEPGVNNVFTTHRSELDRYALPKLIERYFMLWNMKKKDQPDSDLLLTHN